MKQQIFHLKSLTCCKVRSLALTLIFFFLILNIKFSLILVLWEATIKVQILVGKLHVELQYTHSSCQLQLVSC